MRHGGGNGDIPWRRGSFTKKCASGWENMCQVTLHDTPSLRVSRTSLSA